MKKVRTAHIVQIRMFLFLQIREVGTRPCPETSFNQAGHHDEEYVHLFHSVSPQSFCDSDRLCLLNKRLLVHPLKKRKKEEQTQGFTLRHLYSSDLTINLFNTSLTRFLRVMRPCSKGASGSRCPSTRRTIQTLLFGSCTKSPHRSNNFSARHAIRTRVQ